MVFMSKEPKHGSDIWAILILLECKLSQDRKKLEATCRNSFVTMENHIRTERNYTDFRNIYDSLMMNQEEIMLSLDNKKMHDEEEEEEKY